MSARLWAVASLVLGAGCIHAPRNTGPFAELLGDTLYAAYPLRLDLREGAFLSHQNPVLRDLSNTIPAASPLIVDTVFQGNDGRILDLQLKAPVVIPGETMLYYLRVVRDPEKPEAELLGEYLAEAPGALPIEDGVRPGMLASSLRALLGPPLEVAEEENGRAWLYPRLDLEQRPRSARLKLRLELIIDAHDRVSAIKPPGYFPAR